MAKKKDPELLAKIAQMQRELRALVELVHEGDGQPDELPAAALRESVDLERVDRVRKLIQAEPMRFAAIVAATEYTENEVKVYLTKMDRADELVINIGAPNKALWYYPNRKIAELILDQLIDRGVRSSKLEQLMNGPGPRQRA